jgi:hypothetical protein
MAHPLRILVAHVGSGSTADEVVGYCLASPDGGAPSPTIVTLKVDESATLRLEGRWLPARGAFFADFDSSLVVKLQELEATTGAYASVRSQLEEDAAALGSFAL